LSIFQLNPALRSTIEANPLTSQALCGPSQSYWAVVASTLFTITELCHLSRWDFLTIEAVASQVDWIGVRVQWL